MWRFANCRSGAVAAALIESIQREELTLAEGGEGAPSADRLALPAHEPLSAGAAGRSRTAVTTLGAAPGFAGLALEFD